MKPADLSTLVPDVPGRALAGPVERASLVSWPALQQQTLDGLLLRFSEGYTRRANCAFACAPGALPQPTRVAACEAQYAAHSLPCIFRLSEAWPQPELDSALEKQGYLRRDLTRVLVRDLADVAVPERAANVWQPATAGDWVSAYSEISAAPSWQAEPQRRILNDIRGERLLCCLGPEERPVACGVAVIEAGLLGLFDIAVRPEFRRLGHGGALVASILSLGRDAGARQAYLQVTDANVAARGLYRSLGFSELYQYWYRQKPAEA